MAVDPPTASLQVSTPHRSPPVVRTCVGCRRAVPIAELLRVVAGSSPDAGAPRPGVAVSLVPDPRRRAGGRGAWVHPDPACVAKAERRRAFGRALRLDGSVDLTAVHEYMQGSPATPVVGER